MAKTIRSRRVRACVAMTSLSLLLPACGGGGDVVDAVGAVVGQATHTSPQAMAPGLAVTLPEIVDSTRSGQRLLKAVGALDDGGHVVVWLSRERQETEQTWSMWLLRFDALGLKAGPALRMALLPDISDPDDVAVTVLPEGRIGVTFVTQRVEDDIYGISQVQHWPFSLEGSINGMVRVLDTERYPRFSPRFATLSGPVTAVAARDGSHYVSWRYRIVGAAPLAPSVRAQRLAADGEPLGWIQRLDGLGTLSRVFSVQVTSLDEGGWIVGEERVSSSGVRYDTFTQLDVARPLAIPQEPTFASDAFFLDLRGHGSVLFARTVDPQSGELGAPRRIQFGIRGELQSQREFTHMPGAAVALRGGDYLTFEPGRLVVMAQRYTPLGEPVGAAFETGALGGPVLPASLGRGGAVMAWVTTTPDGEVQVLTQRFLPSQP